MSSDTETRLNNDGTSYTTTTITWTYDGLSRLTSESYNDGVAADSYSDVYRYDADGNRTLKTHLSGDGTKNQRVEYQPSTLLPRSGTSLTQIAAGSR